MKLTALPGHATEDSYAGFIQASVVIAGDEFNTR
jgi:hypothetical protein